MEQYTETTPTLNFGYGESMEELFMKCLGLVENGISTVRIRTEDGSKRVTKQQLLDAMRDCLTEHPPTRFTGEKENYMVYAMQRPTQDIARVVRQEQVEELTVEAFLKMLPVIYVHAGEVAFEVEESSSERTYYVTQKRVVDVVRRLFG